MEKLTGYYEINVPLNKRGCVFYNRFLDVPSSMKMHIKFWVVSSEEMTFFYDNRIFSKINDLTGSMIEVHESEYVAEISCLIAVRNYLAQTITKNETPVEKLLNCFEIAIAKKTAVYFEF